MTIDTTEIGGFTIERSLGTRGRWSLAEATGHDRTVELALSTDPVDAPLADRLDRLRATTRRPDGLALALPLAAGRDGDRVYVARPTLPEGHTLADRLADGPLDQAEALRILSLIAGALDTLTAWALPAPPLAPDRVALTSRNPVQPLLYDYGIAYNIDEAARIAIADYAAPELATAPTTATNVYALGCLLVECLTGAPPFPYDRPLLVLNAHRTEPPPRIAAATGLPEALDKVLQSALNKRPEQRQQSAAGLMRAAQRALGRRRFPIPMLAAPPAPPKAVKKAKAAPPATASKRKASPPRRRRRWPVPSGVGAGAGVAAVLLLASTAGYATATGGPDDHHGTTPPPLHSAAAALASPDAALIGATDRAIDRLGARRAYARTQLRVARHPRAQAAAAARLAAAYSDARRALPPSAALAAVDASLAANARAYHRLATAARAGDSAAFRHVTHSIDEREASLDAALRTLSAQA